MVLLRSLVSLAREREALGASEEATSAATKRKGRGRDSSEEMIDFAEFATAPLLLLLLLLSLAFRDDGDENERGDAMAPAAVKEAIPERERGNELALSQQIEGEERVREREGKTTKKKSTFFSFAPLKGALASPACSRRNRMCSTR
jgi:hypothetical protein